MLHAPISQQHDKIGQRLSLQHHDALSYALGNQDFGAFVDLMTVRHLARGEMILDETSHASTLVVVLSGLVKMTALMVDGREQIVGLFFESDSIWRRFPSDTEFLVEATCESDVCLFSGEPFSVALRNSPTATHAIFENTLEHLDVAQAHLLTLGRKSAAEKVASLLIMLQHRADLQHGSSKRSGSNYPTIQLLMTRMDMANYLGLQIETVSRCLTNFKGADLIKFLGSSMVELRDPDRMQAIAENRGHPAYCRRSGSESVKFAGFG